MGEDAIRKSDRQQIKIGTCEMMYYLRHEDRDKVKYDGDLDQPGLFWRLPFPDEDRVKPGEYEDHARGERLYKEDERGHCTNADDALAGDDPGIVQLSHECGLLVNVPCYHGKKLPEDTGEIKVFWNGKSWHLELYMLKKTIGGTLRPVVRCKHCRSMWSLDWDDVKDWVHGEIKDRLDILCR